MRAAAMLVMASVMSIGSCAPDEVHTRNDPGTAALSAEAGTDAARDAELVAAAERVILFLQGDAPFGDIRTADTVTLRLSPAGGGDRAPLPREALHDRANWAVPALHGSQSLVPPTVLPHRTAKPGVHFNCLEHPLASLAPDLAGLPHVGVRLAPHSEPNCLQTWNLTLVFEAATDGPPVLVAAVYDQWEW